MNKIRGLFLGLVLAAALGALVIYINGCGGGGGKDASAPASVSQGGPNSGKVAAAVTLTGRTAGRTAEQTTTTIPVKITISGVYSGTGEPFTPIVETVNVDLAAGYAVVRVLEIPIGVNLLMVAEADWGGTTEIVKAIIPQVEEGTTTSVNANAQTTAVANVAIAYAEQQGKGLHEISADILALIQIGVEYLVQNGDYAGVSAEQVIALLDQLAAATAISVSPATASLEYGATQTFTATLTDSEGQPVFASPTWSVTSTVGIVDSSGVFSATGLGSGEVTATFGELSVSAQITVAAVCTADPDCDDANAETSDACSNGGTTSAVCTNTPYTCNTNADCTPGAPVCMNGGTLTAMCVGCITDPDCDDANPDTIDTCANGGTASAACSNTIAAACFANTECDDANSGTIDTCYNAGTIDALCAHSTNVAAGSITADTTWTLAGSPYIVAGQIQVDPGVTLTIEPGVFVHFDYPNAGSYLFGYGDSTLSGIKVDGTLNAAGTSLNPITFTLSDSALSYGSGYWGGIYFTSTSSGSVLQYANMIYPAYAIQIDGTSPSISNVAITEANSPLGGGGVYSYHVYVKTADGWRHVDQWHYDLRFADRNMNLAGLLPDADGEYKVRIEQTGAHAAQMDFVQLNSGHESLRLVSASDARTGEDVQYKLAARDNDVLDAHSRTFDIKFEAPGAPSPFINLMLNAREENNEVITGGKPFTFPENKFYEPFGTHHYTYTAGSQPGAVNTDGRISADDNLPRPAFETWVRPQSGHPDGMVYGYLKDDGQYLYATLDFAPDNTFDNDADYAALHVRTADGYKTFRLSEVDRVYGSVGFNYTGNVNYQHKVYEFKIPLAEIGSPAQGADIDYVFEAYGTASIFSGTISAVNITSNFSLSDVSISYASGATGSMIGMVLNYLSGASNSLSNISISNALGTGIDMYTVSDMTVTNLDISNPVNTGISAYSLTNFSCTNCSVTNAGYNGASINSFTNISLSSCVFNNSSSSGLYLNGMNGTNTISNCDMSFNGYQGLDYYYGSGGSLSITGSRFAQNCNTGIYIYTYGYETGFNISDSNAVDNVSYGIYAGPSAIASLNGVYLAGNNLAGAGVADTSTTTPNSSSSPAQYYGASAVVSPASSPVSGLPSSAGSVTCGY